LIVNDIQEWPRAQRSSSDSGKYEYTHETEEIDSFVIIHNIWALGDRHCIHKLVSSFNIPDNN
jgi:hypothetical protein